MQHRVDLYSVKIHSIEVLLNVLSVVGLLLLVCSEISNYRQYRGSLITYRRLPCPRSTGKRTESPALHLNEYNGCQFVVHPRKTSTLVINNHPCRNPFHWTIIHSHTHSCGLLFIRPARPVLCQCFICHLFFDQLLGSLFCVVQFLRVLHHGQRAY